MRLGSIENRLLVYSGKNKQPKTALITVKVDLFLHNLDPSETSSGRKQRDIHKSIFILQYLLFSVFSITLDPEYCINAEP